jgi:hypothetical protein
LGAEHGPVLIAEGSQERSLSASDLAAVQFGAGLIALEAVMRGSAVCSSPGA